MKAVTADRRERTSRARSYTERAPACTGWRSSLQSILANPTVADRDHSRNIDMREATFLAVAVSLNNIGVGFSAGLLHLNVMATALCSAAVSFLALWLGARAGQQLGAANLGERAQAFAGFLLVIIGLCQFR